MKSTETMRIQLTLISFFFIPAFLYSADLSSDSKPEFLDDFSGGLNTTVASHKIDSKFTPNSSNVFMHRKPGSFIKRNGFIVAGSTRTLLDGRFMFTFNKSDGSKEFIVSDSSLVLTTKDFITYTFISSGLTTTVGLDCAQVRDKVWCTNGTDPVFTWDGTVKQVLNGSGGLPNVPKGKFIEYWQGRPWVFNTPTDAVELRFADVITTAAEIIAPDDPRAWPATNTLFVGRGDGQSGTALWIQNSRLYIGKDRSIYTVLGNNPSTYNPDIVEPQVGVISNDSITNLDGMVYFKGMDGAYEFNGQAARRITDGIVPDMDAVTSVVGAGVELLWEGNNKFSQGYFINGSTVQNNTVLPISSANFSILVNSINVVEDTTLYNRFVPSTRLYADFATLNAPTPTTFNPEGLYLVGDMTLWFKCGEGTCVGGTAPKAFEIKVKNTRTNEIELVANRESVNNGSGITLLIPNDGTVPKPAGQQNVLFTGADLNNSRMQISVGSNAASGTDFAVILPTIPGGAEIRLIPATTVQYISDIATVTALTLWRVFDSVRNTNGGSINYFYRSGAGVAAANSAVWTSIVPGLALAANVSNTHIQWSSTITSVNRSNPATISKVTITYIQGPGNRDRPFATEWNREWWLSIATGTNNSSIQYVKSWRTNPNPDAWNRLYGMDIRSFTKDGNSTLYGGSASTGTFYRLDYGTNDNGNAISAYYETPDMILTDNFREKSVSEVWVDADRESGNIFSLGISTDNANVFYKTKSFDGSNHGIGIFRNFSGTANTWRFRFENNQLDKSLAVHNVAIWYQVKDIRSPR